MIVLQHNINSFERVISEYVEQNSNNFSFQLNKSASVKLNNNVASSDLRAPSLLRRLVHRSAIPMQVVT